MAENPYSDIIRQDADQLDEAQADPIFQAQQSEPANPYAEIARSDANNRRTMIAQSVLRASQGQPDNWVEIRKTAQQRGLQPSLQQDPNAAQQLVQGILQRQRIEQMKLSIGDMSPQAQDWLMRDVNLGVGQNDLERLKDLDRAVSNREWHEQGWVEKNLINPARTAWNRLEVAGNVFRAQPSQREATTLRRLDEALESGGQAEARRVLNQMGPRADTEFGDYLQQSPEERAQRRQQLGDNLAQLSESVAFDQQQIADIPQDPGVAEALEGGASDVVQAIVEDPGIIGRLGVESTVLAAPALAASVLTGGFGTAAAAGTMALGSFATEKGITIIDVLQEAGVDPTDPEQLLGAFTDDALMQRAEQTAERKALGVAALDLVGAGVASRLLVPRSIGGRQLGVRTREGLNIAAQLPVQAATEGAGEALGQQLAFGQVDTAEVALEAAGGTFSAVTDVAVFANRPVVNRFLTGLDNYHRGKKDRQFLTRVRDDVQGSDMATKDPEALRDFIDQATQESPGRHWFIPVETFNQAARDAGLDPEGLAADMPSVGEGYYEADAAGTDLQVSLADYAAYISGTGMADSFIESARSRPNGMSSAEADQWYSEQAQRDVQDLVDSFATDDPTRQIFDDVYGQLLGTGQDPSLARDNAALTQRAFRNLGQQYNIDPMELYRQTNLRVTSPMPEILQRPGGDFDTQIDPLLDRIRAGDMPRQQDAFGPSLLDFLRERGVQDEGGELAARDVDTQRRAFQRNVIRDDGITLDDAAQAAAEAGYLAGADRESVTFQELLDAVDRELAGEPVFSEQEGDTRLQDEARTLQELSDFLEQQGIDLAEMDNTQVRAMLRGEQAGMDQQPTEDGTTLEQPFDGPETASTPLSEGITEIEVDGQTRPALNSLGEPIQWSEEGIRNFWRWFGDSQAVDEDGRPLVVHHGSFQELDVISPGFDEPGAWFSESRNIAANYVGTEGVIHYVYLRTGRTLTVEFEDIGGEVEPTHRDEEINDEINLIDNNVELARYAEDNRYDSLHFPDGNFTEDSATWVVFDESQIKSATDNAGTFDPESDVILEQRGRAPRGRITFPRSRQFFTIELLEKANASTFIHESGHMYLELLNLLSQRDDAPAQAGQDLGTIMKWLGVESFDQVGVEQHEQFARGFEAYIFEGNAPSTELKSMFARFKAWMLAIYRDVKALGVELTDDVRSVFDRLLATQEEIDAAQREAGQEPMFSAEIAGLLDGEALARYSRAWGAARREAEEDITRTAMNEVTRQNRRWWREAKARMRETVADEVNQRPEYVAASILGRGKMPDGSDLPEGVEPFKISKSSLVEMGYGESLSRLPRPYVYSREGGVPLDVAAGILGYRSGDELFQAMANARPRRQLIEAETDARMRQEYGDILNDGSLPEEALESVHNARRVELMQRELAILRRRTGQRPTPATALRAAAQRIVNETTDMNLSPGKYLRAEQKAGREAFDALAREDYRAAVDAKQRQMLQHFLYVEARRAREDVDSLQRYAKRLMKTPAQQRLGKAGDEYREQVDQLLRRYEFRKVPLKRIQRRQSLAEWVARQEADGLTITVPQSVLDDAEITNYRQVSIEELRGLHDVLRQIEHQARFKNRLLKAAKDREIGEARDETVASIEANATGESISERWAETGQKGFQRRNLASSYLASHRPLSSLAREIDGMEDGGAFWENIVRPLNEAGAQESRMLTEFNQNFARLFLDHFDKRQQRRMYQQEREPALDGVPRFGGQISHQARLMIALNTGNADNLAKLKDGNKIGDQALDRVLAKLEKSDWDFVQGVWDLIDELWPQIEAKEKRVYGIAPEKVQAQEVQTQFGAYRGGYFPLKYDENLSAKSYKDTMQDLAQMAQRGATGAATTARGHTKERVDHPGMPLKLDLGVIEEHLTQAIHDVTHHEALLDVNRVFRGEVENTLLSRYGPSYRNQVQNAIEAAAAGDVPAISASEKILRHLRNGVTISGMAWSLSTTMMQPIGITNSVSRIGAKWVGRGLKRWMSDLSGGENTIQWVHSKSAMMTSRVNTQNREINDIRNRIRGRSSGAFQESLFWTITRAQMMVDVPTWIGQYEKSLEAGRSDADAVAEADQAVIDAQGGGLPVDQADVQRGGPFQKIFTNFMSYFIRTASLMAERLKATDWRSPGDLQKVAVDFFLLYALPSAMVFYLKGLVFGFDEDEEGLDDDAWNIAREIGGTMTGGFFGIREMNSAISGFYGYEGPVGTSFFAEATGLAQQAAQGEMDEALAKSLNRTGGMLFHYPATQVWRFIEGSTELAKGETQNPLVLLTGERRGEDD